MSNRIQRTSALSDYITRSVAIVGLDTPVNEAARMMSERNIGAIPVCSKGRLRGMITDRDIVVRAVAANLDLSTTKVGEVMSSPLIYCFEDQSVAEVARVMEDRHVRRLAVLDRDKKLIGILSISDIAIEPRNERLAGEVLHAIYDTTHAAAA